MYFFFKLQDQSINYRQNQQAQYRDTDHAAYRSLNRILHIGDMQTVTRQLFTIDINIDVLAVYRLVAESRQGIRQLLEQAFGFTGQALQFIEIGPAYFDADRCFDTSGQPVDASLDRHGPGVADWVALSISCITGVSHHGDRKCFFDAYGFMLCCTYMLLMRGQGFCSTAITGNSNVSIIVTQGFT